MKLTKMACLAGMLGGVLAVSAGVSAPAPTFKIGDTAPALEPMAWLKGEPVNRFKSGHVYVVEFWATWCGPCAEVMPHLSELQKKYADRLTVIGMDVRETEKAQTSVDSVRRFVEAKGEKMAYTVAMDDPVKQTIYENWVKAAGIGGIPATFVINGDGKLVWVGNPLARQQEFHTAIEQALNGASDLAAARAVQTQENMKTAEYQREKRLWQPMVDARNKKDYAKVVAEVDKLVARDAQQEPRYFQTKFIALLHFNETEAFVLARTKAQDEQFLRGIQSVKNQGDYWTFLGSSIAHEEGLSKSAYLAAIGYLQDSIKRAPNDVGTWSALARAQARVGNFAQAVTAQERAVAIAPQTVAKDRVEEYVALLQEKLASYRQELNAQRVRSR